MIFELPEDNSHLRTTSDNNNSYNITQIEINHKMDIVVMIEGRKVFLSVLNGIITIWYKSDNEAKAAMKEFIKYSTYDPRVDTQYFM